jgi:hypothetical protein
MTKLTTAQLKKEYLMYYDMINKTDCFGVGDLLMLDKLEKELRNRGYDIEEGRECRIVKVD